MPKVISAAMCHSKKFLKKAKVKGEIKIVGGETRKRTMRKQVA